MKRDTERIKRIQRALGEAEMDAVVCALPVNVLLLSGYWPVVGTALSIATRDGRIVILAPKDEQEFAERGWADEVRMFEAGSLDWIKSVFEVVQTPLAEAAKDFGLGRGSVIGYEESIYEPASYAAMNLYGTSMLRLLSQTFRFASVLPASTVLQRLRTIKTPVEVGRIRAACQVAEQAFRAGSRALRAGLKETEAAGLFRTPLSTEATGDDRLTRADGFTFCMSGANGAQAYAAFQRSGPKKIAPEELVLLHCNSYRDGYWTDITRTYCMGEPDQFKRKMYDAVFSAREAAISITRPGAKASEVDRAAREVMEARGFGARFKHGLGHGVGFAAINHTAHPCLHPKSDDILKTGMVFNVEPAIYIDGYGGLRHCDMVAVTEDGAEVLTPFQSRIEALII